MAENRSGWMRRLACGLGGLALVAVSGAAGVARAADPPPTLTLTEADRTTAVPVIAVDLPAAEGAQTRTYLLSQTGTRPVAGLHIEAQLPRATVDATVTGAATNGTFTLGPSPAVAVVTVAISGVPAGSSLTGSLFAVAADNQVASIAAIKVTRPPEPSVVVADAGETGEVKRAGPTSNWNETLTLTAKSAPPTTGIAVTASALHNETNTSAVVDVKVNGTPNSGEPFDIPAGAGSATVALHAELIDTGTYHGTLTVRQGTVVQVVRLEVDRTKVAPAITVEPILSVKREAGWRSDAAVAVPVSLRETGGRTTRLSASIEGFGRKSGSSYDSITPTTAIRPDAGFTVDANRPHTLTVRLSHIPGPGEYTGKVRLVGGDGPAVDTAFTVFVRNSWVFAGLLILLGVFASELVRWYFKIYRPKLVNRIQASIVNQEISRLTAEAPTDGPEQVVLAALHARLVALANGLTADDVKAGVEEVKGKLDLLGRWLTAWRRVRLVKPPPAALVQKLDSVSHALTASGSWADDKAGAQTTLNEVDDALSGTAEVGEQLAGLTADVTAWGSSHGAEGAAQAKPVQDKAAEAGQHLVGGKTPEAAAALAVAQALWAKLLADDLAALAQQDQPPPGVARADWDAARGELGTAAAAVQFANADDAVARYEEAYRPILDVLIGGLRALVASRIALAQNQAPERGTRGTMESTVSGGNPVATQQAAPAAAAVDLLPRLFDLRAELAESALSADVDQRSRRYRRAAAAYAEMAAAFNTAGIQMGPGEAEGPAAPPSPSGPVVAVAAVDAVLIDAPTLPSPRRLKLQLLWDDLGPTAFIFAAAAVLGLSLLWIPNPAWGEAGDRLIAVLWGLGLHQAGTNAVQGGGGVRKALLPDGS